MPIISYETNAFANAIGVNFNGNHTISTNWAAILHSASTVGKRVNRYVYRHGLYSMYELLYRALIVRSNLKEDNHGYLVKSQTYLELDASEKSAVSFFIGLTSAKFLSEHLLGVKWLLHYDKYYRRLNIVNSSKRSRPDLIGSLPVNILGNNGWVIIEAKGRTGIKTNGLIQKAKYQTSLVQTIQNSTNLLRIASASYFIKNEFNIYWEDPEGENNERQELIKIEFRNSDLINRSYGIAQSILNSNNDNRIERINGDTFIVADLRILDISIGIKQEIHEMLKSERYDNILEIEKIVEKVGINETDANLYIGNDGVLVKCGKTWSSEEMMKEPDERN